MCFSWECQLLEWASNSQVFFDCAGEYEGEGEWDGEQEYDEETPAPYVPPEGADPFAKTPDESEWAGEDWPQETPEQMMHDQNVIIAVASTVAFGFLLAICTAQQVIQNPDGCCARYA